MTSATERLPATRSRSSAAVSTRERTDIFVQLSAEHQEALTLIRHLRESPRDDARTRSNLWMELGSVLVAHERAELQEVYRAVRDCPELQTMVTEHNHQAHRLEQLVDELNATPVQTQVWRLAFQRLEATFRQHVSDEETKFFPSALEALGRDKAELLNVPYLTAKRLILQGL